MDISLKLQFLSSVPLGSTEELPGKSCAEIAASEGKEMAYGKHWIYSDENADQAIYAICEGNSHTIYTFSYSPHVMFSSAKHHLYTDLKEGKITPFALRNSYNN